jgi:DNA replication protein DnaC
MLTEPTVEKLNTMRLEAMASAWIEQQKSAETTRLGFDERFGLLVDAEWLVRENRRMDRLLKEAKLKMSQACIEDVDYPARRELDRVLIRSLATCRWVQDHLNVAITGATGTGKTFLACALAQQACRKGYRTTYRRASRLFEELGLARADGTYTRLLGKIARMDVLVIDDWGLTPVRDPERSDLLEVLEDRYASRSTIMTSQLPPERWHDYLGDPTLADAIWRPGPPQRPPDRPQGTVPEERAGAREALTRPDPGRRGPDHRRRTVHGKIPPAIRSGGEGRKPSVASLRSRWTDLRDHDEPIWVITIAGIRTRAAK